MKSIKRISKVAIVATVAAVLIAAVGAYAYWSVQSPVNGNKITSGTMEFKTTLDDGVTAATPIDIKAIDGSGIMPGDNGLAATWSLTIGKTPSKGVNLAFAVSGVTSTKTLKDSVQVALLLCTGGIYNYWLTPDGPVLLTDANPDDPAVFKANSYPLIDYNTKSWSDMTGYMGLKSADQTRHLKVYYYLPEDADKDSHDDTATFNVMVEALQNH